MNLILFLFLNLISQLTNLFCTEISIDNLEDPSIYPINSLYNNGNLFPFDGALPSSRVLHSICGSSEFLFVYGGYSDTGALLGINYLRFYTDWLIPPMQVI